MGKPTEKTIKRLFALSGNICAFPGCQVPLVESATSAVGEICHIRPQRQKDGRFDPDWPSEKLHDFDNLILLCANHHTKIDEQPVLFTVAVLQQMKAAHERDAGRPERTDDMFSARILLRERERIEVNNNSGTAVVASPGAIVGQTIHVKTTRKVVKVQAPPGTIGADADACRYVQYLINRYNKLASPEKDRSRPFSHGAISRTIESKYGAQWRLLPIEAFERLTGYLQQRIGQTQIAKRNAGRGDRAFSSYSEFLGS